jgi:hypothetical protein
MAHGWVPRSGRTNSVCTLRQRETDVMNMCMQNHCTALVAALPSCLLLCAGARACSVAMTHACLADLSCCELHTERPRPRYRNLLLSLEVHRWGLIPVAGSTGTLHNHQQGAAGATELSRYRPERVSLARPHHPNDRCALSEAAAGLASCRQRVSMQPSLLSPLRKPG